MSQNDAAVYAVIALALHEFAGNNVHDAEPGIITIKQRSTLWNARVLLMTQHP